MARKKQKRFLDNKTCELIQEPGKLYYENLAGNWYPNIFLNNFKITLELACGKGCYTTGLATQLPGRNFVGVDVKGDRLWVGAQYTKSYQLSNAAFLRTRIEEISKFFVPLEIEEIYITFPDPRPKDKDIKRRLTSPRFLSIYKQLLMPGGEVHIKTDSALFFTYTLDALKDYGVANIVYTHDLYQSHLLEKHLGIQTHYEKQFLSEGAKIKYINFSF